MVAAVRFNPAHPGDNGLPRARKSCPGSFSGNLLSPSRRPAGRIGWEVFRGFPERCCCLAVGENIGPAHGHVERRRTASRHRHAAKMRFGVRVGLGKQPGERVL